MNSWVWMAFETVLTWIDLVKLEFNILTILLFKFYIIFSLDSEISDGIQMVSGIGHFW